MSGKTHLLQAVGQELIRKGRRLFFTSKLIKKYARYEGMIIDDLGYIRQTREEMEVVFTLLAERYERGSVLLTSNLPFSKWEGIFKDPMTTAAAIDRLGPSQHHCRVEHPQLPARACQNEYSIARRRRQGDRHDRARFWGAALRFRASPFASGQLPRISS